MKNLIFGVGIDDTFYVKDKRESFIVNGKRIQKVIWKCPYYSRWFDMLKRCYNQKDLEKRPKYKDVEVCDEWMYFSNFKSWMKQQDWEGKALDKDLRVRGSKVYSPETCMFVPCNVNNLFLDCNKETASLLGTSWCKTKNKFVVRCNGYKKNSNHVGVYDSELEGHLAWIKAKILVIEKVSVTLDQDLVKVLQSIKIDMECCLVRKEIFKFK